VCISEKFMVHIEYLNRFSLDMPQISAMSKINCDCCISKVYYVIFVASYTAKTKMQLAHAALANFFWPVTTFFVLCRTLNDKHIRHIFTKFLVCANLFLPCPIFHLKLLHREQREGSFDLSHESG